VKTEVIELSIYTWRNEMFNALTKFSVKMFPIHLALCSMLLLGFAMGGPGTEENWLFIGLGSIVQLYIIGSIPVLIYYYKRRKNVKFTSLLLTLLIFITPYLLTLLFIRFTILS
jgi:hypothetical protein